MSKKLPSKCAECGGNLTETDEKLICNDRSCGLLFMKPADDLAEDKVGWHRDGKRFKPFKQYHTTDLDYDQETEGYRFSSNFLAQQKGLFPFDGDNNEVHDRLQKAGVFLKDDKSDSEAEEVWVSFDDYDAAKDFLDRLNAYLRTRHAAFQELKKKMREIP